jgi:hypothetical protein
MPFPPFIFECKIGIYRRQEHRQTEGDKTEQEHPGRSVCKLVEINHNTFCLIDR